MKTLELPKNSDQLEAGFYWRMSWRGVPIVVEAYRDRRDRWVITDGNEHRDIYVGTDSETVKLIGPIEAPKELT